MERHIHLSELIKGLDTIAVFGDSSVHILSLAYDSRKVSPGTLFFAVKGFTVDGNRFITDAVRKGAVAVLSESMSDAEKVVMVTVPDVRKAMALASAKFYDEPQKELIMTGITGTNGKTTTSYLVKSIFDTAGIPCGVIGTINHLVGQEKITSLNTTPEAPDIYAMLARMVAAGQNACVIEVSSHALVLSRVHGIEFRAAAFLNLSRDHLDFHGDEKKYLEAKSILFTSLAGDATAVINRDDPVSDHIISVSRGAKILTFGKSRENAIYPVSTHLTAQKSDIVLDSPAGEIAFTLPLPGHFNIYNAMAAVGIAMGCGLPREVIIQGLEHVQPVKGRYETIDEGQDFAVIVDYAHTPDALERILNDAKELAKGRLIVVFGCGGDRDKGKRPLMGEIAVRTADVIIVTSDNPRTENPFDIIDHIVEGIPPDTGYETIPDREEAIRKALSLARKGDTVVIAGKGHESYQVIGTERRHFDDAETTRRILGTMR